MNKFCITIFALCFLLSSSCYAAETKKAHCKSSIDCANVHPITQLNFNDPHKHSKTLVISKPGNYCLAETIKWCPKKRNKIAIIIDASNVTLDLSGHELKQVNDKGRCIGILVRSGHDTIKILNGAVRDFTQLGIVVEGGTSNIFLGNDDTVLKVTGCGYGSELAFIDDVDNRPILQGGIVMGQTQLLASKGYYTWKGNVDTAKIHNVYVEENGPIGFNLGTGSDITFQDSYICRNSETREVGVEDPFGFWSGVMPANSHVVIGLLYAAHPEAGDLPSKTFTFNDCHFDLNSVTGGTQFCIAFQMSSYNLEGLTVRRSTFNSNVGSESTDINGFGTFGTILDGSKGVLFEDCEASYNRSEFAVAGFHHSGINFVLGTIVRGEGLVYRRCNAIGNTVEGDLPYLNSVGMVMFFMDGLTIEDCQIQDNVTLSTDLNANPFPSTQGLLFIGYQNPDAPVENAVVSGCHISGNRVNSALGDAEGIVLAPPTSKMVIEDSVIQSNDGADFNAGILLQPPFIQPGGNANVIIQRCSIENQFIGIYSKGDNNGIYQNNAITDVEYGVLLDGSSCDSINNNYVTNAIYGFVDTSNPSTSLFSNNKVFGAVTPYDVTYTFGPVPVVSGSLLTGFPTGAEVLDNVFMDNPTCTMAPTTAAVTAQKAKKTLQERVKKAQETQQKRLKF